MIVNPTNKSVTELEGLHLFHADISNCSMRVRMALAEKHLDMDQPSSRSAQERDGHARIFRHSSQGTGADASARRRGAYRVQRDHRISRRDFPGSAAAAGTRRRNANEMRDWLRTATEIHVPAVKTLIYTRKIGKVLRKNEQDANYRSLQRDPELLAFHSRATTGLGLPKEKVDNAEEDAAPPVRQSRRTSFRSTNGWSATNSRSPTFPGCRCTSRWSASIFRSIATRM